MKAKLSRTKAFGFYGVILRNPNWSLSGRSPDGRTVSAVNDGWRLEGFAVLI
jgi:hypothetical protein